MKGGRRASFYGETLPQAMIAMKGELGHDSVLIAHRKVKKGGLFGLGAKEYFEVIGERLPTWLLEENRVLEKKAKPSRKSAREEGVGNASIDPVGNVLRAARNIRRNRRKEWVSDEVARPAVAAEPAISDPRMRSYGEQLRAGGELVHSEILYVPAKKTESHADGKSSEALRSEISRLKNEVASLKTPPPPACPLFAARLAVYHERLVASGVRMELCEEIALNVRNRSEEFEWSDDALMRSRMVKEIKKRIAIARPLETDPDAPRVIVAVGATGVGKTTTLAKLGAILSDEEKRRVAYISLDYYRVGGADQLRSYSELMGVPFEAVSTAPALGDAINRNLDREFIMIDTAGRNPYRADEIETLKGMLRECRIEPELLLFVSATTDESEMPSIIRNFSIMKNVSLVFSKVDESRRSGQLFNLAAMTGLPIAFLTTGQSVPDDIEPALASKLADVLLEPREDEMKLELSPRTQHRDAAPARTRPPDRFEREWTEQIW